MHYVKNHTYYARVGLAQFEFSFSHRSWYAVMTYLDLCSCRPVTGTVETMRHIVLHTDQQFRRGWGRNCPSCVLVLFDCRVPPSTKTPQSETKMLTQIPSPPSPLLANQSPSCHLSVALASLQCPLPCPLDTLPSPSFRILHKSSMSSVLPRVKQSPK